MGNEKYEINGFQFVNRTDYERALKEYNNIIGLQGKMNVNDIDGLKVVFRKLVSKNYFRTPVGMNFLYELRDYIVKSQGVDDLPGIPVPKLEVVKSNYNIENNKEYIKVKEELNKLISIKNKLIIAVCALCAIVVGMVFIVLTNDNSGFFNAEEKVLNKYSTWQEQLDQKEKELKDLEESLNEMQKDVVK